MFSSSEHTRHHFFLIPLRIQLSLIRSLYIRRKLRNPRNRLHMHLFASFIMRAFMALLKDWSFIDSIGLAWDVVFVDGKSAFIREHNVKKTYNYLLNYSNSIITFSYNFYSVFSRLSKNLYGNFIKYVSVNIR